MLMMHNNTPYPNMTYAGVGSILSTVDSYSGVNAYVQPPANPQPSQVEYFNPAPDTAPPMIGFNAPSEGGSSRQSSMSDEMSQVSGVPMGASSTAGSPFLYNLPQVVAQPQMQSPMMHVAPQNMYMEDVTIVLSSGRLIMYVDPGIEHLVGIPHQNIMKMDLANYLPVVQDKEALQRTVDNTFEKMLAEQKCQFYFRHGNGQLIGMELTISLYREMSYMQHTSYHYSTFAVGRVNTLANSRSALYNALARLQGQTKSLSDELSKYSGGMPAQQMTPYQSSVSSSLKLPSPVINQQPFRPRKRTSNIARQCTDCGTDTSPEWRKGPLGPKTLCNACGLRYAKNKRTSPNNM